MKRNTSVLVRVGGCVVLAIAAALLGAPSSQAQAGAPVVSTAAGSPPTVTVTSPGADATEWDGRMSSVTAFVERIKRDYPGVAAVTVETGV